MHIKVCISTLGNVITTSTISDCCHCKEHIQRWWSKFIQTEYQSMLSFHINADVVKIYITTINLDNQNVSKNFPKITLVILYPKLKNNWTLKTLNSPYWNCKLDIEGFLQEIGTANKLSNGWSSSFFVRSRPIFYPMIYVLI